MSDQERCRAALSEQLCRMLEETAFMLVENPDAPLPQPGTAIEAQIPFSGKAPGKCWLVVPEADAAQTATEMLGISESEGAPSGAADNAVAELLNILTAWVLEAWWGEDVPHSLGLPSTQRRPLTETRFWKVPEATRVIVTTDSGCTFMSCVTEE
jgi:hypothetical protein